MLFFLRLKQSTAARSIVSPSFSIGCTPRPPSSPLSSLLPCPRALHNIGKWIPRSLTSPPPLYPRKTGDGDEDKGGPFTSFSFDICHASADYYNVAVHFLFFEKSFHSFQSDRCQKPPALPPGKREGTKGKRVGSTRWQQPRFRRERKGNEPLAAPLALFLLSHSRGGKHPGETGGAEEMPRVEGGEELRVGRRPHLKVPRYPFSPLRAIATKDVCIDEDRGG